MTSKQRYISNELTHFIGRDKANNNVLYQRLYDILKEGMLTHSPKDEFAKKANGMSLRIYDSAKFSENEMFVPEMVCFCDIPTEDLHIHIQKYGPFGISFSKDFIAQNGGSPVYYLPKNAYVASWKKEKLGRFFDNIGLKFYKFVKDKCSQPIEENDRYINLDYLNLLGFNILGYIKFFDHNLPEDDPNNFYFEREWRVLGNVNFKLTDVQRILLPKSYSKKFREDFPQYYGQLSFTFYPEVNNPDHRGRG